MYFKSLNFLIVHNFYVGEVSLCVVAGRARIRLPPHLFDVNVGSLFVCSSPDIRPFILEQDCKT